MCSYMSIVGVIASVVNSHCLKRVHSRSYSGPYFPAFGLMRENADQNNSEYGHFLRSAGDCVAV